MARKNLISCLIISLVCLAMCLGTEGSKLIGQRQGKTWCVARNATPDDKLQKFIDFACGKLDCAEIQAGGSCYEPNTLPNHASYALDLYYRANGVCDATIGTPAITDPSFGNCRYP